MEAKTVKPKRHILVVDDDERVVREVVDGLSGKDGFEIHAFTQGQAAREALQQSSFDLLVADWTLPDVDGLTLIRETQMRSPDTVTVLLIGVGSPEIQSVENACAHHYLEKPFAVEELLSVIDSFFPEPVSSPEETPLVIKVVLGGDANVGKTSLIQRYCTGKFDPDREMTIGVDFHLYDIKIEGVPVRLVVWDLGGQERFSFARRAFYRGAQSVGLVFDASNRTSFYNLMRWWRETREYVKDVPVLLLANKTDLPRQIVSNEGAQLARAWNTPLFESSCATGDGVDAFFEALARHAWKYTQRGESPIA